MHRNDRWSMDFVSDQLLDRRRLRVLTLSDSCTRESLASHAAPRPRGIDLVQALEGIVQEHRRPGST